MAKKNKIQYSIKSLIPIILSASLVPLIVRLKLIPLEGVRLERWNGNTDNIDFFSYWKGIALLFFVAIAIISFYYNYRKDNIIIQKGKNFTLYYITMSIYTISIVLSTFTSKYSEIALKGFNDRWEGMFILLCYVLLFIITFNMANKVNHVNMIIKYILISSIIIAVIGLGQFLGQDIFATDFGSKLIMPLNENRNIKINFDYIYSTLYNPNYVGSYVAITLMLSLGFFFTKKTKKELTLGSIALVANVILWSGSLSSAGMIGSIVAIVIFIVILRDVLIKNIKKLSFAIIGICLTIIILNAISGGRVNNEFSKFTGLFSNKTQSLNSELQNPETVETDRKPYYYKVYGKDNEFIIHNSEYYIKMSIENGQMVFRNKDDKFVIIKRENNLLTFEDEKYKDLKVVLFVEEGTMEFIIGDEVVIGLAMSEDGLKYIHQNKFLVEMDYPERLTVFDGKEKVLSQRVYMWARTIPMLKNYIFLGVGPDCFVTAYPQYDFTGKMNAFEQINIIVDKPHNWYLQMGVNTGVISMLGIIIMLAYYLISSIKLYFPRTEENKHEIKVIGSAIFSGILAYSIAGIANDSVVSVAPVFWVVLGLGVSINYIYKNKLKST